MKAYNGFSGLTRYEADKWLKEQCRTGAIPWPSKCDLCGNTGIVDYHCESYDKPFGEHIYRYCLCYSCHMMLHCRFTVPERWHEFIIELRKGGKPRRFNGRLWDEFKATYISVTGVHLMAGGVMTDRGRELLEVLGV